ncbi:DUF6069 family protein [Streptomyces sp. NPDC006482]|uniref:DUF6069 family protein n=1 Tax=Streptomyces sp. NPDC006482 TaxID=3154306 RepID=UPI00339DDEBB
METPQSPYGYETDGPATPYPSRPPGTPSPSLDAQRLWVGGLMTAVVAALTAVVAVLLVRGVLGIPVFAPEGNGAMGDVSTGLLAGGAFVAALAATGLMHVLIIASPGPVRFFSWIVGLVTAVMMLLPFTTEATSAAKVGTAAVYLVIGIAIGSLLTAVARGAVRRGR